MVGSPSTRIPILVDGLPTADPSDQTYTLTPSPDSIQEFKVITTPFSAEFGHTGGGVMILTSKSGSNVLHGFVLDCFPRPPSHAAPVFGTARARRSTSRTTQESQLAELVVIPKVYDSRNKTFFLLVFNVTLASNGNLYQQLVPTALGKAGDFSQTLSGGKVTPIYDPQNTVGNADGKVLSRTVASVAPRDSGNDPTVTTFGFHWELQSITGRQRHDEIGAVFAFCRITIGWCLASRREASNSVTTSKTTNNFRH